jgi:hypothetical protein
MTPMQRYMFPVWLKTRARNCGTPEVMSAAVLHVFMYILLASAFWEPTQRVITVTLQLEILSPNFNKMKSMYCNIRQFWASYLYPEHIAPYSSVCAITGAIYRAGRCEKRLSPPAAQKEPKVTLLSCSMWRPFVLQVGEWICHHHNPRQSLCIQVLPPNEVLQPMITVFWMLIARQFRPNKLS